MTTIKTMAAVLLFVSTNSIAAVATDTGVDNQKAQENIPASMPKANTKSENSTDVCEGKDLTGRQEEHCYAKIKWDEANRKFDEEFTRLDGLLVGGINDSEENMSADLKKSKAILIKFIGEFCSVVGRNFGGGDPSLVMADCIRDQQESFVKSTRDWNW